MDSSIYHLIEEWNRLRKQRCSTYDLNEVMSLQARIKEIEEYLKVLGVPRYVSDNLANGSFYPPGPLGSHLC